MHMHEDSFLIRILISISDIGNVNTIANFKALGQDVYDNIIFLMKINIYLSIDKRKVWNCYVACFGSYILYYRRYQANSIPTKPTPLFQPELTLGPLSQAKSPPFITGLWVIFCQFSWKSWIFRGFFAKFLEGRLSPLNPPPLFLSFDFSKIRGGTNLIWWLYNYRLTNFWNLFFC